MKVEEISTLITQKLETIEEGDPCSTIVIHCFNIFTICIRVQNGMAVTTQGLEQLGTVFARGLYCAFHRLRAINPTSGVLEDICQRYHKVFPGWINFTGLQCHHTMIMVDALIKKDWSPHHSWCEGDRPSNHDHIQFAHNIAELAQEEYQRNQVVPKWILNFTFDSLSLDPHPPGSFVANCLRVIAISLGCVTHDEKYVYLKLVSVYLLIKS